MTRAHPRRLLILACSATKRRAPGLMPARERYDGPLWRTLRAADPDSVKASVAFFSAKYGFGCAATPIADYEARLTQADAQTMIAAFTRAPVADAIGVLADAGGAPFEGSRSLAGGFISASCAHCSAPRRTSAPSHAAHASSSSTAPSASCALSCAPGSTIRSERKSAPAWDEGRRSRESVEALAFPTSEA